ncbi:SDR family oxidoreductase [Dactylosporangium sp. AC04546]
MTSFDLSGRGRPEDLVGAAVFLASPAADYVAGHVLVVDGGWMAR